MAAILLPTGGFTLAEGPENKPRSKEADPATDPTAQEPEPGDPTAEKTAAPEPTGRTETSKEQPEPPSPLQATEDEPEATAALEQGGAEAVAEGSVEEKAKKPESMGLTESVTVTATRVETELMKTPIAVTVVDQDELNRQGVKDIREMATLVPNMDIATINGQSAPIISLRGVRSTNETELGDPAVGIHLDGVYSPRMQGIPAPMFDNGRVEVLRGPQGTLFGRNSTVGNINIVTAKPDLEDYKASLSLRFGNYSFRQIQAMVNVPASKKLGFRFAGRAYGRNSYVTGYWDPNQYDQRYIPGVMEGTEVIAPPTEGPDGNVICSDPRCYARTQHSNWWAAQSDGGTAIRELTGTDTEDFYMNAEEWAYRVSALWKPSNKRSFSHTTSLTRWFGTGAGPRKTSPRAASACHETMDSRSRGNSTSEEETRLVLGPV